MSIKKDENVLAGKKTPNVLPIETKVKVTNAQTGKEYASEERSTSRREKSCNFHRRKRYQTRCRYNGEQPRHIRRGHEISMQGLQSLNQFKDFVSSIGGLGRYEDTYIVHAAEGETVVPMEVLDQNPVLKKRLFKTMMDMGIEPGRYIVGNELNSKNPITGQPEFFLKKVVDKKKAAGRFGKSGYRGLPIIGAMYGAVEQVH